MTPTTNPGSSRVRKPWAWAALVLLVASVSGCVSSRSPLQGRFALEGEREPANQPVKLLFVLRHFTQTHGLDTVPKLEGSRAAIPGWGDLHMIGLHDFPDIFAHALSEIRNIDSYATFTEWREDSSNPDRVALKEDLLEPADFVVEMTFLRESRFAPMFFAGAVSTLTLSVIPVYFDWDYSATVEVYNREDELVGRYTRSAELRDWVQLFLVFAYPFHPRERKLEEIYSDFLHNIFLEIDCEGILSQSDSS